MDFCIQLDFLFHFEVFSVCMYSGAGSDDILWTLELLLYITNIQSLPETVILSERTKITTWCVSYSDVCGVLWWFVL